MTDEERLKAREYFRLYAAKLRMDPKWRDKNNKKKRNNREENGDEVRRKDREYKAGRKDHFAAYEKKWKVKNRERYLASRKNWNLRHRDELNEKARQYVEKNRDAIRERQRNSTRRKEYAKQYKSANRDRIRVDSLSYYYEQRAAMETDLVKRMRSIYMAARTRAKAKGIPFDDGCCDEFIAHPPVKCGCCGVNFDFKTRGRNPWTGPSLDKVNNSLGYVLGNVAIICRSCNTRKRDMGVGDMRDIIKYIQKFDAQSPVLVNYYGVDIPTSELHH